MKNFQRQYPLFSLCGLNCGLCPMYLNNNCPGCGGGEGHQSCAIVRCSQQHGGIEYCYMCGEYPCERYDGVTDFDSFITHRNMIKDFDKAKNVGLDAYQSALNEKVEILRALLDNYNDGRRKTFFCISVNLLDLQDVKCVVKQIIAETKSDTTVKERSTLAVNLFKAMAEKRNIVLKLNKKAV